MLEKLGITPAPWNWYISTDQPYYRILPHDVKIDTREDANIIIAAPEMLQALISVELNLERFNVTHNVTTGIAAVGIMNLIEKATGKSWEEIKEEIK